ncbi:MAG TPA: hypothetical protein DD614_01995 [Clostridiales bacterium]|nr:hypothetical protein [Clostridiales bacterium]
MLAFISFCLVIIGSVNWFCIGILQYDFVAGLFGSQSNVFSRLIYTLVGIASIIVTVNLIKNKGKFVVSFKKANKEYNEYMEEKKEKEQDRVLAKANTESAKDNALDSSTHEDEKEKECDCTSGEDKDCTCKDDCDCHKK